MLILGKAFSSRPGASSTSAVVERQYLSVSETAISFVSAGNRVMVFAYNMVSGAPASGTRVEITVYKQDFTSGEASYVRSLFSCKLPSVDAVYIALFFSPTRCTWMLFLRLDVATASRCLIGMCAKLLCRC
jgi:hypothetical protein